jgi:hypothetical protein
MFSSARSIIATLVLSTIVVGTPPLAGSESWADFFRDLFSIADYESMIEDENKLTDQLNRKDAIILGRLNSKNKVIDALQEGKISFSQAAACFYFIQKETNDLLEISDKNFKHLPKETQSAINLLQWAKSSIKMSDAQQQDYEKFRVLVENSECEGSAVSLPLPPVFLITEMFN